MANDKNSQYYQYYVEGEDEKCIINVLKTELRCIKPGKIEKFNVIQKSLTTARIRTLKMGTVVVLVFDTDTDNLSYLRNNISFLKNQSMINDVICIPQISNLEEELLYSCKIKKISDLTQSRSEKDFKRDLLACTNVRERLEKCEFSIDKFWSRDPGNAFSEFSNQADMIKLRTQE